MALNQVEYLGIGGAIGGGIGYLFTKNARYTLIGAVVGAGIGYAAFIVGAVETVVNLGQNAVKTITSNPTVKAVTNWPYWTSGILSSPSQEVTNFSNFINSSSKTISTAFSTPSWWSANAYNPITLGRGNR